jgi:hypothetical protein
VAAPIDATTFTLREMPIREMPFAAPICRLLDSRRSGSVPLTQDPKAVTHAKVHDLIYLKECLKRASPKAKAAWEQYYPTWVSQVVEGIKCGRAARTRRDPSSVRSILASLTDDQKRTAISYRKLKRRRSRGTGKRVRGPSRKSLAIQAWKQAHEIDAAIVHGVLVERQGIAGLGQKYWLSNGAVLERLRLGLDSLRAAIDGARAPKGPQQSARLNGRGQNTRPDLIHIQEVNAPQHRRRDREWRH